MSNKKIQIQGDLLIKSQLKGVDGDNVSFVDLLCPGFTGVQATPEEPLVPEEGVLGPTLLMVAGLLLRISRHITTAQRVMRQRYDM